MRAKGFYAVLKYERDTEIGDYFKVASVKLANARACLKWIKDNGTDGGVYIGARLVTKVQNVKHEQLTLAILTEGPEVGADDPIA